MSIQRVTVAVLCLVGCDGLYWGVSGRVVDLSVAPVSTATSSIEWQSTGLPPDSSNAERFTVLNDGTFHQSFMGKPPTSNDVLILVIEANGYETKRVPLKQASEDIGDVVLTKAAESSGVGDK